MELSPKELIIKLYEVISEIINTYNEIVELIDTGENIGNVTQLIKLKILIMKENLIIKSIPREKVEQCLLIMENLTDEYLESYGLDESDLFHFEEDENPNIKSRIRNKLFQKYQIQEGRYVSFNESLLENTQKKAQFGTTESMLALLSIEQIKSLTKQFNQLCPTNKNEVEFLKELKINLNKHLIQILMDYSVAEYLILYYSDKIDIEQVLENSLNSIKLALFVEHSDEIETNTSLLGIGIINKLMQSDIDIDDSQSVYEYMSRITKLDIILSYANKISFERIQKHIIDMEEESEGFRSEWIEKEVKNRLKKHKTKIYRPSPFFPSDND